MLLAVEIAVSLLGLGGFWLLVREPRWRTRFTTPNFIETTGPKYEPDDAIGY